jgi:hypothetical protein
LNAWIKACCGENTMKRFVKMKNLREYLQYVKKIKYDADRARVAKTLKRKK